MKKTERMLWGVVLMVVGILWVLNAWGLTKFNIFFPGWWTLIIILPCAISLVTEKFDWGYVIGIGVGVILMLGCLEVIDFGMIWKSIVPLIVVAAGVYLVVKTFSNGEAKSITEQAQEGEVAAEEKKEMPSFQGVLSSQKVNYKGKKFEGCKVKVIFGTAEVDLRGATIEKGVKLKTVAFCGGIKVLVDEDVAVDVEAGSIFGGVTKMKDNPKKPKAKLQIDANGLFGGVEVK